MKNKRKLITKISIFLIAIILLMATTTYANDKIDIGSLITPLEYTDEYKAWTELSEEERNGQLEPRKYDVQYEKIYSNYLKGINNKIRVAELLKNSNSQLYNLKSYIPNNVRIKNQMNTNTCWAFAGIATLESHFAVRDYKISGSETEEYDFSERHMAYSASKRSLLNSNDYKYGYDMAVTQGGNAYHAQQYLTTGNGAVTENDMPFVNSEANINVSEIQGKDVQTTLWDTTFFETAKQTSRTELVAQMKSHITNYGGIWAGIHGAQIFSDNYNNATGAIYCNSTYTTPMNHAILIIGWDDTFSVNNFNSNCKPTGNGAWIIKNSWGEEMTESLTELKQSIYNTNTDYLNSLGYYSAQDIPNDFLIDTYEKSLGEGKVIINEQEDIFTVKIGDNGYMYVSYEDVNIYSLLWGIENAKASVDYDEIYMHDELGACDAVSLSIGASSPLYMANVFSRNVQNKEALTKISLFTFQEYTCKVYVNPKGSSLAEADLEEVTLAEGETVNIKPGYHTIEFAEPIELTGNTFAVAVKINNSFSDKWAAIELPVEGTMWQNATFAEGQSFIGTSFNNWIDMKELESKELDANLTIKAFTNDIELQEIKVIEEPSKKTYFVGENFDSTGMKVQAVYSDSTDRELTHTEYTITDGNDLQLGKTTVTISYTENEITKTTTQAIVVQEKVIEEVNVREIEVFAKPTKVQYIKDVENLDLTGGLLTVKYTNNTEQYVDMTDEKVTATGFDNTKLGIDTITITYADKTTTFDVEIIEEPKQEEPKKEEPTLTDLQEIEVSLENMEITNNNEESYYTIDIKVKGIKISDENTKYTYYYYLSGTQGDDNIADEFWIQISENNMIKEDDGTYSLNVKLDSRNILNKTRIIDSDNLYLYVKEVATRNNSSKSQIISKLVTIKQEVDDETSNEIDDAINNNGNNDNNNTEDDTIVDGNLPFAGVNARILMILVGVVVISIFSYRKIKDMNYIK